MNRAHRHIHPLIAQRRRFSIRSLLDCGRSLVCVALAGALTFAAGLNLVAHADDTEVFYGQSTGATTTAPNVLFLIDTGNAMCSSSTGSATTAKTDNYPGSGTTTPTATTTGSGKNASTTYTIQIQNAAGNLPCEFGQGAVTSVALKSGSTTYMQASSPSSVNATNPYYANKSTGLVTLDQSLKNTAVVVSYTYNMTRLQAVEKAIIDVLTNLANKGTSVNVGLMRLSVNGSGNAAAAKGGMIVQAVKPVTNDATKANSPSQYLYLGNLPNILCTNTTGGSYDLSNVGGAYTSGCLKASPNGSGAAMPVFDTPLDDAMGSASSPLTEMMFEAYLYYSGGSVLWGGSQSNIGPGYSFPSTPYSMTAASCGSVTTDRNGTPACSSSNSWVYQSPISTNCQQNFIIILSDGVMSSDTNDDIGNSSKNVQSQTGFTPYLGPGTTANGTLCSKNNLSFSSAKGQTSDCPDDLAYYMNNHGGINPAVSGSLVTTYTVGFDLSGAAGSDATNAKSLLTMIARAGGGKFLTASDEASLETVFQTIFDEIVIQNATFSSPAVAVNSFNRTQDLSDLYISVFAPQISYRWPGNVKKYHLDSDGTIVDQNANPAVDNSTGFFKTSAQSYWSTATDGSDARVGGAASKLPTPSARVIYTNYSNANYSSSYAGETSGSLTYALSSIAGDSHANAILGTTASASIYTGVFGQDYGLCPEALGTPTATQLIDWAYGADLSTSPCTALRQYNTSTKTGSDPIGDPLHTKPAVVVYGGTPSSPDSSDSIIFELTNDGYLHAIRSSTGVELWAFMPYEELKRLLPLYQNGSLGYPTPTVRTYGLDGNIQVLKIDKNGDGVVDASAGDKVYIYFGMRRGGSHYYALDVTCAGQTACTTAKPKLLWVDGSSTLTNLGQTWSTPRLTKATISGTTIAGGDNYVLIFGGGYDAAKEDVISPQAYVTDTVGTGIYMVDAYSGALLWRAGPDSGTNGANLVLTRMTNAFPGDVRAIDLTGSGYAQRIYAADLGGRLWRFDIDTSGSKDANHLVSGGVLASIGSCAASSGTCTDVGNARRFFVAPDVAFIAEQTSTATATQWVNVGIGSGNREMPISDKTTLNRYYSFRDTNATISGATTITEASMVDVTPTTSGSTTVQASVPLTATGWYLTLQNYSGEKVVSESRTFQGVIYFPSFLPEARSSSSACLSEVGVNYLYVVSAFNGTPYLPATASNLVDDNLAVQLNQAGIAPNVEFLFPAPSSSSSGGTTSGGDSHTAVCKIGVENCPQPTQSQIVRTWWRRESAP
jgi:type IV pilus assembly protein PilY1